MNTNDKNPDIVFGSELSEKYIRTFAGDMETLQKGGIPDLVPLVSPSTTQTPTPTPTQISEPPLVSVLEPQLSAGVVSRRDVPPLPDAGPIKTYADDFSERMKEKDASTATVLAAEQDAVPRVPYKVPETTSRWNTRIIAGTTLLIVGGLGIYIAYTRYVTNLSPIFIAPTVSAPIFVDDREQISGTGPALLQAIEQSVTRSLPTGAARLLYMASTTNTDSVFSALRVPAPDILLRNVNAVGSMAGIVNTGPASSVRIGDAQSPFFILSVLSYSNTFSGMLSWERQMPRDLQTIFPPYPAESTESSVATSTFATTPSNSTVKTTSKKPTVPAFMDEVVANHDVRIFRDAAGRSILLYGYWNQTTLIIARDAAAFTEIVQRLATSRAQ